MAMLYSAWPFLFSYVYVNDKEGLQRQVLVSEMQV